MRVLFVLVLLLVGCAPKHQELLYDQKPGFYTYIIGDVNSARPDIEHNADAYITPASCQKTITALLAYKTLGSDYRFKTDLYTTYKKDQIQDVVIAFSGDPLLSSENLQNLLAPLKSKTINGHIILDASLYQTPTHSNNIMRDDVGTFYGQPVSAMSVDKNLINVTITPSVISNDAGYKIDSDVIATNEPTAVKLSWEGNIIKARGNFNIGDESKQVKISPPEIDHYILNKISPILKNAGIKGKLLIAHSTDQLPKETTLINSVTSDSLGEIIPPALKISDNLVFDSLYLRIINNQSPIPIKDWEAGDPIVKSLLKGYFDMDMGKALFVDGSGLSRYNRVQPRQLYELLRRAYSMDEFVAAMPTPGETEARKNLPKGIRAKTGSMSGISCLCGYKIGPNGTKTFAIIANSFAPPLSETYIIQDKFLRYYLGE